MEVDDTLTSSDDLEDETEQVEDAVMLDFLQTGSVSITSANTVLSEQQMDVLEPQATDLDRRLMRLS